MYINQQINEKWHEFYGRLYVYISSQDKKTQKKQNQNEKRKQNNITKHKNEKLISIAKRWKTKSKKRDHANKTIQIKRKTKNKKCHTAFSFFLFF